MADVKFPKALQGFYKSSGVDPVPDIGGPSLTRQEFAEECDINSLMKRYEGHAVGGPSALPPPDPAMMYVDLTSTPRTLLEYMDLMQTAEAAFMSLPAIVRKEFDNNAHAFVDFAGMPENLEQMRTWGLAPPAPVVPPEPVAAPPVSSAPPPGPSEPAAK